MSSDFDPADFVDRDFQVQKAPQTATFPVVGSVTTQRAPTREEVDTKVSEAQQRLAELKRVQEDLERERASLEETRRRRIEFQTGRQEMVQSLTRGVGLLEEAEFAARLEAEQMGKTLAEFRNSLAKIEAVQEDAWTKDNFNVELTRGLTAIENARMEWNAARLKFAILTGQQAAARESSPGERAPEPSPFRTQGFWSMCKLGLALTWPLTAVALIALMALLAVLFFRH